MPGNAGTKPRSFSPRTSTHLKRKSRRREFRPNPGIRFVRLPKSTCRSLRKRVGQKRSEEHTSELQSLMRISYAVFCLKKKHKADSTQIIQEQKYILNNTKTSYRTK